MDMRFTLPDALGIKLKTAHPNRQLNAGKPVIEIKNITLPTAIQGKAKSPCVLQDHRIDAPDNPGDNAEKRQECFVLLPNMNKPAKVKPSCPVLRSPPPAAQFFQQALIIQR